MANKLSHQQVFSASNSRGSDVASLAYTISSGTVTLQKLVGNDESGTWVDVTDGAFSASGETSFHAPAGQKFRVSISGSADVYYAG